MRLKKQSPHRTAVVRPSEEKFQRPSKFGPTRAGPERLQKTDRRGRTTLGSRYRWQLVTRHSCEYPLRTRESSVSCLSCGRTSRIIPRYALLAIRGAEGPAAWNRHWLHRQTHHRCHFFSTNRPGSFCLACIRPMRSLGKRHCVGLR